MRLLHPALPFLLALVVLAGACSDSSQPDTDSSQSGGAAELPSDPLPVTAQVLVTGLRGPTQMAFHPDGRLLVAEINQGEGTPTGTVSAIDLDAPEDREILVEGLDTPTGLTVADGRLWIMERTQLATAPLEGGPTDVVFADMPNNGRSEGSLATLSDGSVVFDTSGRREGFGFATNSATLWSLDPADPPSGAQGYGTALLDGMKHAYAVAELDDGRLAVSEMSDGRFDGERAPDELLVIDPAVGQTLHGGWPRCIGNRQPVEEYDGTAAECESTVPSRALFDAGATPTGVEVAPWDPGTVLVTNWTQDRVMAVSLQGTPPVDPSVAFGGIPTPQDLLADGDRVLLTSHTAGQILALTDPS